MRANAAVGTDFMSWPVAPPQHHAVLEDLEDVA